MNTCVIREHVSFDTYARLSDLHGPRTDTPVLNVPSAMVLRTRVECRLVKRLADLRAEVQQQGENATTYLEGLTTRALRDVDPWWNQDVTTEA